MKIKTHLISGAGNTFHIANQSQAAAWPKVLKKQFANKVCSATPADGFIFLKNDKVLSWDFFNNDGSDAEMCGNATRCVGLYLSEILREQKSKWALQTAAGVIEIEKIAIDQFKIIMTEIQIFESSKGFFCDTGVPHLIQEIAQFQDYRQLKSDAAFLRNNSEFQPHGTNVTYVELLPNKNQLRAVSYERGVEDFTEACGTGAMAAAAYNLMKRGSAQTQVEMPGGTLMMDLTDMKRPIMIGPAKLIGTYEYENPIR